MDTWLCSLIWVMRITDQKRSLGRYRGCWTPPPSSSTGATILLNSAGLYPVEKNEKDHGGFWQIESISSSSRDLLAKRWTYGNLNAETDHWMIRV